jgi:hypothetical protein
MLAVLKQCLETAKSSGGLMRFEALVANRLADKTSISTFKPKTVS